MGSRLHADHWISLFLERPYTPMIIRSFHGKPLPAEILNPWEVVRPVFPGG